MCVWAWIAQRRIDELNQKLAHKIELRYHYIDVFGDVSAKINFQWKQKGMCAEFSEHVQNSPLDFEDKV